MYATKLSPYQTLLVVALLGALGFSAFCLSRGFGYVILDMQVFRQSQTALSVSTLPVGGPWIAYETPVLGAPWAIPFESPTYQWIVALVCHFTGLSVNQAGRLVSYVFFLATLLPIWMLVRAARADISAFLLFAILYVLSPIYLFWGHSVMIETTAVFFCALWLALTVGYVH
jgi:hypothetical protein